MNPITTSILLGLTAALANGLGGAVIVQKDWERRYLRYFVALGAGFMLVETKAVVAMAFLFGSTWVVNSVVFFAVLVMILLANRWTLRFQPERLWPYYAGLLITLILNTLIPLDFFLGMTRGIQIIWSSLLVFAPILFAGVIFAVSFKRTSEPDRAFGMAPRRRCNVMGGACSIGMANEGCR